MHIHTNTRKIHKTHNTRTHNKQTQTKQTPRMNQTEQNQANQSEANHIPKQTKTNTQQSKKN